MNKKKILFVNYNNNFSGSVRVLLSVIQDIYANTDYKVITTGENGFLNQLDKSKVIYIKRPNLKGKIGYYISLFAYSISLFIISFFYGIKSDIFYINTIMPYQAVLAGKLLNKDIIYHVHEKFIIKGRIHRIAEFIFYSVKAKRIYVSNYLKDAYKDSNLSSEVVYNKLSKDFTSQIKIRPIEERKRKNITLISAKASFDKGVDIFYKLSLICPDYNFYFISEESEDLVRSFINCSNLNNFHICSGRNGISSYLENTDILVNFTNPKYSIETFGMTILEAMAYGIPSIAPNYGGPKELIVDGLNGFLIDNIEDIDEIKNKLFFILTPENYSKFANNSLKIYKKFCNRNTVQ